MKEKLFSCEVALPCLILSLWRINHALMKSTLLDDWITSYTLEIYIGTSLSCFSSYRLSQAQLMLFSQQVCKGMVYLAGMGFIHTDLAARNILLSADYVCKVGDIFCCIIGKQALVFTDCWFWHVKRARRKWILLLPRTDNPYKVDCTWGHQEQQILKCEWRMELWLCALWDMELGEDTFWEHTE